MREMLTSLPSGAAYLTGPDLVIEFANDAWRRLAGDRAVVGRPLRAAMPELAGHGRLRQLKRSLESGEACHATEAEVVIRRRGARARHLFVDLSCQPVRDAGGAIAGITVHATDVTPHVRARDGLAAPAGELEAAEERFRMLFETMPEGILHCDADGSIIEANHAASEILGIDLTTIASRSDIPYGELFREDGSPFPAGDLPVPLALRTGKIIAGVLVGASYGQASELRWMLVTALPAARDEQGRPTEIYAIFSDMTELWRAEIALRRGTAWLGRLRDANVLSVLVSDEERLYEANDAFLEMIGRSREDLEAGRLSVRELTPPEWVDTLESAAEQLRQTGVCQPFEVEYIRPDGRRVPVLVGSVAIDRHPLRWTTFVVDLSARQRAEEERAELRVSARANHAEAESARERLSILMRAGALVAATRDRDELLDEVARLLVPSLADICLVLLPTADGMLRVTSVSHRDPARAELLARMRDHPVPPVGPMISQRAYASRTTQLGRDFPGETAGWSSADVPPALLAIIKRLNPASAISTPLLSDDDGPLGVIMLSRTTDRPLFDTADVQMVEELSRRLAVGIANADTFAREHAIAATLQRSLLPDTLPRFPGLELAFRYLPATVGADIGGDWYDGFPLPDGRIGLVIGDVIGHNITSATIMGQLRSMIRAYAIDDPAPDHVLERANAALGHLLPDALASVVYAVLDTATGELDYAGAGHPPPLVSTGRGHAEYLADAPGIMLGAPARTRFTVARRRLQPGSRLLFYTDGLIEDRHRDITDGLAILAETLRQAGPLSAEQTCAIADTALLGAGQRHDDVCLLAAHLTG